MNISFSSYTQPTLLKSIRSSFSHERPLTQIQDPLQTFISQQSSLDPSGTLFELLAYMTGKKTPNFIPQLPSLGTTEVIDEEEILSF